MTVTSVTPKAPITQKLVIDCRGIAGMSAESVVAWMTTFPQPSKVHVVLPSSTPGVRKLQCTLQSMGCGVTRVTKCPANRYTVPANQDYASFSADF
jgi:hypothetical protein